MAKSKVSDKLSANIVPVLLIPAGPVEKDAQKLYEKHLSLSQKQLLV